MEAQTKQSKSDSNIKVNSRAQNITTVKERHSNPEYICTCVEVRHIRSKTLSERERKRYIHHYIWKLKPSLCNIQKQLTGNKQGRNRTTPSTNELIYSHRTFHTTADYTFFSSVHGTFTKIDHIVSQN